MSSWLTSQGILLDVDASDRAAAVQAALPALAQLSGMERSAIARALEKATRESDAAIGSGIAVPHAPMAGLAQAVVVLVRLAAPIEMAAIDRVPVDLLFVTLFPADDPAGHLAFLAHLAHLGHSRVFRDGLRSAAKVSDVVELVDAAELRRAASPGAPTPAPSTASVLAVISLAGEKAVDAALVSLIDAGLEDATILDAQSVSEAASREVPLFAAFQDIFGDPGGRRVIFAWVSYEQIDPLTGIVRRACEEWKAASGEVIFVPVAARWKWTSAAAHAAPVVV